MSDTSNLIDFDSVEEQLKNCAKDIFVEKLIDIVSSTSCSADSLASIRASLHQKALDNGLPLDKPVVKCQRSNPGSACCKYATDCFLLYSFITGTSSVMEIKEVFGCSLPPTGILDGDIPASQRTPPSTPSCTPSHHIIGSPSLHMASPLRQAPTN